MRFMMQMMQRWDDLMNDGINDGMIANRANLENNNDKWVNPSSEMGNKSIPMLETAEMQVSLDSSKSLGYVRMQRRALWRALIKKEV